MAAAKPTEAEARRENIDRWIRGGPACIGDPCGPTRHADECPRGAYITAGSASETHMPGLSVRWPYDRCRVLAIEDAEIQAYAEAADREALAEAEIEAYWENLRRWTEGGPRCTGLGGACGGKGHADECPRHAYIVAGPSSSSRWSGLLSVRWPYDRCRVLHAQDAEIQAYAEAADREALALTECRDLLLRDLADVLPAPDQEA